MLGRLLEAGPSMESGCNLSLLVPVRSVERQLPLRVGTSQAYEPVARPCLTDGSPLSLQITQALWPAEDIVMAARRVRKNGQQISLEFTLVPTSSRGLSRLPSSPSRSPTLVQ